MARARRRRTAGFTLLELIIAVTIIGILAAVAIPVVSGYVYRSKAAEAGTVLQGIRDREYAYHATYKRYTDNMAAGDHMPRGGCVVRTTDTINWNLVPPSPWIELGFVPDGPTYYSYIVYTNFAGGVMLAQTPMARGFTTPIVGTRWPGTIGAWFVVEACGDVDADTNIAHWYITSHSKQVYHLEEEDSIY